MAQEFSPAVPYWMHKYVIVFENAEGKDEEFYSILKQEYEKVNLPNTRFSNGEFALKKTFFSKTGTCKMYCVKSEEFENFGLWFRATVIGNMLVIRMYEMGVTFPGEKNILGTDYMCALDWLGNFLFYKVIAKMDPDYKEKIQLYDLKRTKTN